MAIKIESDIIIGNFLIEMFSRNISETEVATLFCFEKSVTQQLRNTDYYDLFMMSDVFIFAETYPFLLTLKNNRLRFPSTDKKKLDKRLTRYFRYGISKELTNVFVVAAKQTDWSLTDKNGKLL